MDLSGSKRCLLLGYFEEGINSWCSVKGGQFLDQLADHELLSCVLIRAALLSERTKCFYLKLPYFAEVSQVLFVRECPFSRHQNFRPDSFFTCLEMSGM
jgi:hypothetical protein